VLLRYMRARDPRGVALRQPDDGLLDIGVGAGMLCAGAMTLAGLGSAAGVYAAFWLPLALAAKAGITLPRVATGDGEPRSCAQYVPGSFLLPVLLPFVMTLLVQELASRAGAAELLARVPAGRLAVDLLPGLLGAVAIGLGARGLGRRRFSAYALLTLGVWLGGPALRLDAASRVLTVGAVITACGGTILRRFLRSRPPVLPALRPA